MSVWYQRQFGDRSGFALCVSLHDDDAPVGDAVRDASWGTIELWAGDRCLTGNRSRDQYATGVRWNLLPILEWLVANGVALVNEEPLPLLPHAGTARDASHWFDATLQPPLLDAVEEEEWFSRRSAWRQRHALRRAAEDAALPNVLMRRHGSEVEISWDNEGWSPPRPDLTFVEPRGCVHVPAKDLATTIRQAVHDVLGILADRIDALPLRQLAVAAQALEASPEDWRWLIPSASAECIRQSMPELAARLDEATERERAGLHVPHTQETLILRHVHAAEPVEIIALLDVAEQLPDASISDVLRMLRRPEHANAARPWEHGNRLAEETRDALGWGVDPLPDLRDWLTENGVHVLLQDLGIPLSVALLTRLTEDRRALALLNPRRLHPQGANAGLATSMGHLLMDVDPLAIQGDAEDWPTAARARAFGVALALPEDGVRSMLGSAATVDPEGVMSLMQHFGTGPVATVRRLENLRIVGTDQRDQLLAQVSG